MNNNVQIDELYSTLSQMDQFSGDLIPDEFVCEGRVEDVFADDLTDFEKECVVRMWHFRAGDRAFAAADLGNDWWGFVCNTKDGVAGLKALIASENV